MKVPAFVLDPRSFSEGKEAYISIDNIEPGATWLTQLSALSGNSKHHTTGFAKLPLTFRLT